MSALAGGAAFARLADVTVSEPSTLLVELHVRRWSRPVRMELRITPWWRRHSTEALVELLPRERRVRLTAAYFDAGHRLLDEIIGTLPNSAVKCRSSESPFR
jgi:hypothetical protein